MKKTYLTVKMDIFPRLLNEHPLTDYLI